MATATWWGQPFVNDGGPLILLPYDAAQFWAGTQADYDAACDARRPFDVLPAGPAAVVVAGSTDTMLYSANWARLPNIPGITMVGWDTAADDREAWLVDRNRAAGPELASPPSAVRRHVRRVALAARGRPRHRRAVRTGGSVGLHRRHASGRRSARAVRSGDGRHQR